MWHDVALGNDDSDEMWISEAMLGVHCITASNTRQSHVMMTPYDEHSDVVITFVNPKQPSNFDLDISPLLMQPEQ